MVATQSHPLRISLRAVPGVPIVHVKRAVMILEPASDATLRAKNCVCYANNISCMTLPLLMNAQAEQDALRPSTSERDILDAATPQVEHVPKKKRGPKAPNPLSVKKKTRKQSVQEPKKANFTRPTGGEQVEAKGKRKQDESDSNDEASSPKLKRRRRRKSHSQLQGENM